ncbi:MAG: alpha/beta hydrolase family protein [Gemmiger sp.]
MTNKHAPSAKLWAGTVLALCMAVLLFTAALAGHIARYGREAATADVTFPSVRGTSIHATVTLPGGAYSGGPLVVMCHGFTGNRNGDGHFQPLAETLAQAGIAVIRVDFPGNGESEEPFTAYTLTAMYDDIESAIDYMTENYGADRARVGLLGHSMGGRAVTMHLSDSVAAAALWSPADNDGLDGLEFLDHDPAGREELRRQASADGSVVLPRWGNTEISGAFVEEMADSHPWELLQNYHGALLVSFAGGDVELLSQQTIDGTLAAAGARGEPFLSLYGQFARANHNYTDALDGDAAESARIVQSIEEQTAQFFVDALCA